MSIDYYAYLDSPEWSQRRKRIIKRDDAHCMLCSSDMDILDVHHNTYERLGHERDTDLITLCRACHEEVTAFLRRRRNEKQNIFNIYPVRKKFFYHRGVEQKTNEFLKEWDSIMILVKNRSIPSEVLLKNCHILNFEKDVLLLGWPSENLMNRFSGKKHHDILEVVLKFAFQKDVTIISKVEKP